MSMLAVTLVDASVQRSESLPKLIQEYGATCPTLSSVQYLMTLTILSFALCVLLRVSSYLSILITYFLHIFCSWQLAYTVSRASMGTGC